MKQQIPLTRQSLRTPRAAGILFAILYAIRMAAVFMISLGVIWTRTHVMPRLFVLLTFVLAVLLVSSNLTFWLTLVFPAWIFVISVFILIVSLRAEQAQAEGIVGSKEGS